MKFTEHFYVPSKEDPYKKRDYLLSIRPGATATVVGRPDGGKTIIVRWESA